MNRIIHKHFRTILKQREVSAGRVLEVGGVLSHNSLLMFPEIASSERTVLNLIFKHKSADTSLRPMIGNANDMSMFSDGSFDLVMSNAMLEHNPYFWKSIFEMHRVLAPGGLLIIGVPGFTEMPNDRGNSTKTFKIHDYPEDYYRFSPEAMKKVFFEGFEDIKSDVLLDPPRIVTNGIKPH